MKSFASPSRTGISAGILVVVGMILWMFVSKIFLVVAALGAFGPGVLREFGWLRDHDEYQRRAAHRAGYHAYLVVGLIMAILGSFLSLDGQVVDDPVELIRSLLVLLWLAWMFSSLISFWGSQRTTATILSIFGSFWAMFILISLIGGDPESDASLTEGMLAVLFGVSIIAAFFVPVWTAFRWPKPTGFVLIFVATALLILFYSGGRSSALQWTTILLTDSMLILPLYICGIALTREKIESEN